MKHKAPGLCFALAAAIASALGAGPFRGAALAAGAQNPALAPVQLSPQRRQLIGLRTAAAEERDVSDEIDTTGNIEADEELQGYVQTRIAGWIDQVFANQTFQYVRKGQPLFTIYSPDLVATQEEYLVASRARDRLRGSSVEDVAEGAASLVEAARQRLLLFGISSQQIARLERQRRVRRTLEIDAPMNGYIVERNALPHMYVQPDTKLYAITDLSRVWVYAAVFQDEIGRFKIGDPAVVTVDAYPGESFGGRISYIWPQIDMATRTARVRLEIDNPKLRLQLGMFGRVALRAPLGRHLVIPDTGVLRTGDHNIVFIDQGGGYLTPTEVELGPRVGHEYIVLKGLQPGAKIVSSANFLIDSESQLQAAIGSFAPPPPGVSAAANQPAAASLEISTDPSPPSRGNNKVRIKLRDASGHAVSGAQVTLTFFMPAMASMGMAAMREQSTATDEGNGTYEANVNLGSGGTWQVTVRASKAGQLLASRETEMSATGGM